MTLTQLKYILAIEEHRHFGKAAKACAISQPTLSMQVQKLEEELNLVIFDRSKSPVIPTIEGEKYLTQARKVLYEAKKLDSIKSQKSGTAYGNLKIGIIPTLSPSLLPLFLDKFLSLYPQVELEIYETQTHKILEALEKDQLDAGIMATPLKNDHVIERVLFYEPFKIFLSKNSKYHSKKSLTQAEIDNEKLWLLEEGHCFRDQALNICNHYHKIHSGIRFESGQLQTLMNLVKKGEGLTFIPLLQSLQLSTSEKKQYLKEFAGKVPSREVSLVSSRLYQKESLLELLEQVIIDTLPSSVQSYKKSQLKIIDF